MDRYSFRLLQSGNLVLNHKNIIANNIRTMRKAYIKAFNPGLCHPCKADEQLVMTKDNSLNEYGKYGCHCISTKRDTDCRARTTGRLTWFHKLVTMVCSSTALISNLCFFGIVSLGTMYLWFAYNFFLQTTK